MKILLQNL